MGALKFYGYNKCSTCVKAKKYLQQKDFTLQDIDITQSPPSATFLADILKQGDYKITDLFNKSGELYRELNMKDKIKTMSDKELLTLLSTKGKLVKRPIVSDGKKYTVGFKEEIFAKTWR